MKHRYHSEEMVMFEREKYVIVELGRPKHSSELFTKHCYLETILKKSRKRGNKEDNFSHFRA